MQNPRPMPSLHVSADLFREHTIRIEKNRRIADDLKHAGDRRRQRLEEIEPVGLLHGDEYVDARGFKEGRYRMTYVAPGGGTIDEIVVIFFRPTPGEPLWLTMKDGDGGAVPLISADLFDAKIVSGSHATPADRSYETRTIPRVDGRGAFIGVYSVAIDAR